MKIKVYLVTFLLILVAFPAFAGSIEFIWSEDDQNSSRIYTSAYQDGAWQDKVLIAEDENLNFLPALGSDSQVNRLAVWVTVSENGNSILKFSFERNGGWESPGILTDRFKTNLAPVVIFDSQDRPWVFWAANDGDDDDIFMSHQIEGHWTEPVRVNNDNDVPDILPRAGLDAVGQIWVSWQQLQDDLTYREVSRKLNNGKWMGFRKQELTDGDLKNREALPEPPPFFRSLGRATFHFPGDKQNQSTTIMRVE